MEKAQNQSFRKNEDNMKGVVRENRKQKRRNSRRERIRDLHCHQKEVDLTNRGFFVKRNQWASSQRRYRHLKGVLSARGANKM